MFSGKRNRFAIYFIAVLLFFCVPANDAPAEESAGKRFHQVTKLRLRDLVSALVRFKQPPPARKTYQQARVFALPAPDYFGEPFEAVIQQRRSVRNYSKEPLTLPELSQLLFAAQGISGREQGISLRTAPSAGALYPVELYVFVFRVTGLQPGLYHYVPHNHTLALLKTGAFRKQLIRAALDQEMVGDAAATIVTTAVFGRITFKYGERGYRYAYMEAGHISQNLALQATSFGLGSVCVGAFFDDALNDLLGIDGASEAALYMQSVGRQRE